MTETKHTPGPWMVEAGTSLIWNEDYGFPVAEAQRRRDWNRNNRPSWDEIEANARLIAAAPDLLAELRSWVEPWNGFSDYETQRRCDPATWERIKRTRAAIAKATGG